MVLFQSLPHLVAASLLLSGGGLIPIVGVLGPAGADCPCDKEQHVAAPSPIGHGPLPDA